MKFTSEGSIHVDSSKDGELNSVLKIQKMVLKKSSCHISERFRKLRILKIMYRLGPLICQSIVEQLGGADWR